MSRLTQTEIREEVAAKGYNLIDATGYSNLSSDITISCPKQHKIITNMKTFRNINFTCPYCDGNNKVDIKKMTFDISNKRGFRIISLDNATERSGVSVFEDGELIYYHLFQYAGDTMTRILKNKKVLKEIIIDKWKPDLIVFEEVQQQQNVQTFKTLSMLLGVCLITAKENGVNFERVYTNSWRSHFILNLKDRKMGKKQAIEKVKKMYDIDVNDDVAEAILIGKYASDIIMKKEKKLF